MAADHHQHPAVRNILSEELVARSRKPGIMADAAMSIVTKPGWLATGQRFIDDDVLARDGVRDFEQYRVVPGDEELELDFWMNGN